MEDETALAHLLLDVVFMETVGMRPVIPSQSKEGR